MKKSSLSCSFKTHLFLYNIPKCMSPLFVLSLYLKNPTILSVSCQSTVLFYQKCLKLRFFIKILF